MSQWDILNFLKQSPRAWFSCRDIMTYLEVHTNTVANALRQLRKFNWVEYKKAKSMNGEMFVYRHKKMRTKK